MSVTFAFYIGKGARFCFELMAQAVVDHTLQAVKDWV